MTRFLLICLGGAAGTGARYLTFLAFGGGYPATLVVNVTGSFLLGFLMHVAGTTDAFSEDVRLALTTGVMGGFTTYSTFNYETSQLFRTGAWGTASMNIVATLIACLIAGVAGAALARVIVGR
jgi:CrcB protein